MLTTRDAVNTASEKHIHGTALTCIVDTGADVNLVGMTHLHDFDKAGIPYAISKASKPLTLTGAIGTEATKVTHTVNLSTLRLTTSEGPVEFTNVNLYLLDETDEMILGLPFTTAIGFDISKHLVSNYEELKGTDLNNEADIRRVRKPLDSAQYVPVQMDARAPLDDADPLEIKTPCLHIGEVDPDEEEALLVAMLGRAYDAIGSYRSVPHYSSQVPRDAEAIVERLLKTYTHIFSSKLTGRPPCKIAPIRIPLK